MDEMELTLLEDDNILDLIQEAPGDDEGGGGENVDLTANDDAGNEGGNDNADNNDNNDNANNDDNENQNQNDENKGNQENDDNFDIDTDEGDNPDEGNDENDEGGDTPDAGTTDDNAEPQETDAEKERNSAFDRIYNDLTPAEKQKRDTVLRMQYKDLYLALDGIINDTSEFPNTTQTNKVVRALIRNLRDFKKYVSYYLTDIYSTKSHLENKIQYDTFMQIFHGIEKIYKDLSTGMSHEYDSYGREIDKLDKN